jgi:hypothetical protein
MQIASNPDISVVSPDDISESAKEEVVNSKVARRSTK